MVPSARTWVFTVAAFLAPASGAVAQQARMPEATVKAAFVIRFPQFVHWPATAHSRTSNSLSVCLSSSHPFGASLSSFADPPTGPPIKLQEVRKGDSLRECDVLYVAPSDGELLDEVQTLPILTIGDQPGFCQRGGIINLLVIDGRVRFEICLGRANRAGLKIDSQLLNLASKVYGGHP